MSITDDIYKERDRQNAIHGNQIHQDNRSWFLVLMEEVGEVAEAILTLRREQRWLDSRDPHLRPVDPTLHKQKEHLRDEIIQVIAVSVAWVEALDADAEVIDVPPTSFAGGLNGQIE